MSFSATKGYITKPPAGVRINPLHPLSRGLVGCWLFNEGAGSRASDISGHGNHGTLKNMSPNAQGSGWGGSKFGGGLKFDGVDDYVDAGNDDNLEMSSSFTLCVWLKTTSTAREDPLGRWTSADGYAGYGFSIYNAWGGRGVGQIGLWTGDTSAKYLPSIKTINDGIYHFVVGTYDGVTGKIYIDGVFDNSEALANNLASPGRTLFIGKTPDDAFNGSIDSVHIYNRALSASEVKQLYHDPFAALLRVPVRYVPAAAGGLPIPVAMNHYRRRRVT